MNVKSLLSFFARAAIALPYIGNTMCCVWVCVSALSVFVACVCVCAVCNVMQSFNLGKETQSAGRGYDLC